MTRIRPAATRRPIRLVLALVLMLPATAVWAPAAVAQDPVIATAGDIACAPGDPVTADHLPPAGDVRPARDGSARRGAPARRHPVRQRLTGQHPGLLRPDLGTGEGDQPSDRSATTRAAERGTSTTSTERVSRTGRRARRGKGWYSFDVGTWHLVALNSNCGDVGCTAGSEQEQWLRADLAAHPTSCTLAYWHHPRYSSGHEGNNTFMQPLWEALDDAGAEIVLVRTQP